MLGALTHQKAGTLLAEQLAQHVLRDVLSLVDDSLAKKLMAASLQRAKAKGSAKKRAQQRRIVQADQSVNV